MPKQSDRALPDPTVYDDTTGKSVPWREYFERHPSSPRPIRLGPGERINPFADPHRPLKWRRPDTSTNPFGPQHQPWEHGHYGFRSAYEGARAILEADDAIVAFADSETADPAFVAPDLFAAAAAVAAHHLRDAVPAPAVPEVARAAALIAWHDALRDHADRASGR
jgi:hypothetical protein